jgi:hypothetical protein
VLPGAALEADEQGGGQQTQIEDQAADSINMRSPVSRSPCVSACPRAKAANNTPGRRRYNGAALLTDKDAPHP